MNWYVVVGRIAFDEEDTLLVVQADSVQAAVEAYESHMRAQNASTDDDDELFINYVVACGTIRPVIELSN